MHRVPTQTRYLFAVIFLSLAVDPFLSSAKETQRNAVIASDLPSHESRIDPAREAAQEILRQQGSIVTDRDQLQDLERSSNANTQHSLRPRAKPVQRWSPDLPSRFVRTSSEFDQPSNNVKVKTLREAAWQLDTLAHRLENLDLYEQADELRAGANRLRHDARKRKQKNPTTTGALTPSP